MKPKMGTVKSRITQAAFFQERSYGEVDPCIPGWELGAQKQVYTEGNSNQSECSDLSPLLNTNNMSAYVKKQAEYQGLS